MTGTDLAHVADWVMRLFRHCSARGDEPMTAERATEMAVMLLDTLPAAAFRTASLAPAGRGGNGWFPSYDQIRVRVAAWWRDHAPHDAPPALAGPRDGTGLDPAERLHLAFWHKRQAEIAALADPVRADRERARLRGAYRQRWPRVLAIATGGAADVAGTAGAPARR